MCIRDRPGTTPPAAMPWRATRKRRSRCSPGRSAQDSSRTSRRCAATPISQPCSTTRASGSWSATRPPERRSDTDGAQRVDHLLHQRDQGGVGHLEVLNPLGEPPGDRMLLKAGDLARAGHEVLEVLLQLVQEGATLLVHALGPLEVGVEAFELFTQQATLIFHGHPSRTATGIRCASRGDSSSNSLESKGNAFESRTSSHAPRAANEDLSSQGWQALGEPLIPASRSIWTGPGFFSFQVPGPPQLLPRTR